MKCFITLFLLAFMVTLGFSQDATNSSSESDKIIQDLIQVVFDEIWSDMDSTALDRYHTEDFIILEHGEVWTNQTIRDYIRRALVNNYKVERINKISILKTRQIDENTIWAAYDNDATFPKEGEEADKMHWLESVVAVKTEDGWKLEMMHSTRAARKDD